MTLPLYPHGSFGFPAALVAGALIGFGFGFVLERAGFGRASVLAAQFYFRDTRVLKVMFSAIVTAMLGVVALDGLGLLDVSALTVPETYLWPQLVGGLLLGVGFILSGYCPGTSVVAMASGKLDGLVTVAGVVLGSLLFGYAYPLLEGFQQSGALGVLRLSDLMRLPAAVLAGGVVAMAVGAFLGAEKLEAALSRRRAEPAPPGSRALRNRIFTAFAAGAAAGMLLLALPSGHGPAAAGSVPGRIRAPELARWLIEDPTALTLVDLRGGVSAESDRMPGAAGAPPEAEREAFFASLPATRALVLVGPGGLEAAPPAARAFPGKVLLLEGGFAAFRAEVLEAPALPADATPGALEDYELRAALHGYFTGAAAGAPPVERPVPATRVAAKKKAGGCS